MEKLSEIARLPSGGSSEHRLDSVKPSSGDRQLTRPEMSHLATIMSQFTAAFPHQEFPEETTEIFALAYEDLALEFGLPTLEQALRWFLTRQKYFPHPAETRELLETMAREKREQAKKLLPPLGCDDCRDNGWSPGYLLTVTNNIRLVTLCKCRIARNAAKRGEPVKPAPQPVTYDAKARAAGE